MALSIYRSVTVADSLEPGGIQVHPGNALFTGTEVLAPGTMTYRIRGLPAGTYWIQDDSQPYALNGWLFVEG